jgi:hypothetical protein
MPNNLDELLSQAKANSKLSTHKNSIEGALLIGAMVLTVILLAGVLLTPEPKQAEAVNPIAQLEQSKAEQERLIIEAEKTKQIAELRKQATELELQAVTIESNDSN